MVSNFILLLDYNQVDLVACFFALPPTFLSYQVRRIAGDFLSSRKTARAERYTLKTTAAEFAGS